MYKVFHTGWHPGWVIYFGWNTSKSFQACPCLMYSVGATETHFIHLCYFSDMSAVDAPLSLSTNFLQFFFSCSNRPKVRSARMMSQQVFNQRMKISFLVNTTSIYKELDIETLLSQQEKGKKKSYNILFQIDISQLSTFSWIPRFPLEKLKFWGTELGPTGICIAHNLLLMVCTWYLFSALWFWF